MDKCEAKVACRVDNVARSVAKNSWERSRGGNFAQEFEPTRGPHCKTRVLARISHVLAKHTRHSGARHL